MSFTGSRRKGQGEDLELTDQSMNLPMVGGFQDQGGDPHYQNISVDSHSPESDETELRKVGEIRTCRDFEGGVTRYPFSKNVTNPGNEREFTRTVRL